MAVDKFKFVSPGVFIDEIDESGIPSLPERMGPLVIGRFKKGPSNRPIKVDSFKDFVKIFGDPEPGNASGDIFRTGDMTAPTYAAYAVKAWLRNNSPCTVYRILGEQSSNASTDHPAQAGYQAGNAKGGFDADDIGAIGGAYGLFVMPNPDDYSSANATATTINFASFGNSDDFTVSVPTQAGGTGTAMTVRLTGADATGASSTTSAVIAIGVSTGPSAGTVAETVVDAINGFFGSGGTYNHAFASANSGVNTGIAGVTATLVSSTQVKLTADNGGAVGNAISVAMGVGSPGTTANLAGGGNHPVTGTLAAVWYIENGGMILTGTTRAFEGLGSSTPAEGAGVLIKSDTGLQFTAKIYNGDASVVKTATFNFNRDSDLFIRKVFNTDPSKTNGDITPSTSTALNYWLGETFESAVRSSENSKLTITGSTASDTSNFVGTVLALDGTNDPLSSAAVVWGDHRVAARAAQTGWFFSQDTRGSGAAGFNPVSHTEKLFKFHALDSGEHANRDYKVSIVDIKVPTDNYNKYGSFTVQVRKASDTDGNPVVLEQYSSCNLNPTSANFIGRKIGDRHFTYDETNKRIVDHGDNDNRSSILRVEVSDAVRDGGGEGLNPYGVYGPSVPLTHKLDHSTVATVVAAGSGSGTNTLPGFLLRPGHSSNQMLFSSASGGELTSSIEWPTTRLRASSSEGSLVLASKAYFGYQSLIKDTRRYDHTNTDILRGQPSGLDPTAVDSTYQQYSWVFTLDDVRPSAEDTTHSVWQSGSRAASLSWTALSGSSFLLTGSGAGIKKFTSPMFGGFDGFDITEQDPLANRIMSAASTEQNNSVFYSIKKAIDLNADADFVEYDLVTIPGLTNTSLNSQLITACEERGDSLAIIDLPGGHKPAHERNTLATSTDAIGDVETTVTNLKDMNLNTSYGCAFYPFVKIRDNVRNAILYVPPSVVALGTFSSSQRKSAVWFAPAGFTRGGLSEGSAGVPVLGVRQRLTSDERDRLYDANINPIASFPAEGIVIFGQKTLQVTQSALDRINVRRLMIYVKKEISRIASRILFDQNVQATWDRFKGQVIPFLEGVQAGSGLTDFRVLLDDSTTTPDLIDRNIMYAKIFLKPARAIEFIALDFIITRTGASFDD